MIDVTVTAFQASRLIASGPLNKVAQKAKQALDRSPDLPLLIFDDTNSRQVEIDFRGSVEDVLARLAPAAEKAEPRSPGRPKLGVVGKEITLLPRQWEWLNDQPGGPSATLRRLVDEARRASVQKDRQRQSRDSAYRFMSVMAGNEPGFEEASRALFAGDRQRFEHQSSRWPAAIRTHAAKLASDWFFEAPKP